MESVEVEQAKVYNYKSKSILVLVNVLVLCPGEVYSL